MRRRYDQYGDPYPPGYGRRRWGRNRRQPRYRGGGGDSCLRDACLIETGCCIGEAIEGSCLMSGLLLAPQLLGALVGGARGKGRAVAALVAAIRLYQRDISAHRPAVCRFTPSCSQYAVEALQAHGVARGVRLAAGRLGRCRPGGRRGVDPVPVLAG
jgi:uncharacterized protein